MAVVEDRRVRRTRRNITEAFIGLVTERGYHRVTVADILERADVGRSTFYAHFRDKEALLLSCFDGLREDLGHDLDAATSGVEPGQLALRLFAHAYRHRLVYRALCGRRGGDIVQGHLHTLIAGAIAAHLAPHPVVGGSSLPPDAVAEFYTAALLGLLAWWVDHDFPHGPEQVARMYATLADPGLRAAAGHRDGHAEGR